MDTTMNYLNPDISIIVPVYNVEKYLVRCLDSIFNQEFSGSFEVIAVEDASTDNSLHVLKSYQEKETRLKVIEHAVNKKISITRATGMKAANGDYIMFIDSDDWILPNALKNIFKKCIDSEADVVVFNFLKEDNIGNRTFINNIKKEFTTIDKHHVKNHFYGALWNKIIKRTLIENMISGKVELSRTEDLLYGFEILIRAKKICLSPESYYVYYSNVNSLTTQVNSEQYLQSQIVVLDQIQKIISKYNVEVSFSTDVLNYFESWIYLELAKIHFWKNEKLVDGNKLVRALFQFPIMTKSHIRSLELSMKNRFVCLFEVYKRFGLRMALGIIRRS